MHKRANADAAVPETKFSRGGPQMEWSWADGCVVSTPPLIPEYARRRS